MTTKNVLLQHFSIQLLSLWVITSKSLLRMRNKDATITRSLEGTKDTRAGCGTLEANVKITFEGSWFIFTVKGLRDGESAIWFRDAFVLAVQPKLF
jgi:hypothetical protein